MRQGLLGIQYREEKRGRGTTGLKRVMEEAEVYGLGRREGQDSVTTKSGC